MLKQKILKFWIWKSYNYVNCGVKNYMKEDHRNYRRKFCSCEKAAWKNFRITLHPAVHVYDFQIFKTSSSSFHGSITNQFNDLLPVGFYRALHRYRRSQGFESCASLIFFRLSFRDCKSCVYNCDDLLSYKKYCNRPFPSSSGPLYLD